MLLLGFFALAFFALHRVSAGALRARAVAISGEAIYRGVFALLSLICLVGLWIGFRHARGGPVDHELFALPAAGHWVLLPLQLLAVWFIVAGLTTRNPGTAGLESTLHDADVVRGMLRVTRHPFLWGVALFSAAHLVVHATVATLGFFGTLLVLALSGTRSIDAKRRRACGARWLTFEAATSNVPFAALLSGRQRLHLAELGTLRAVSAVLIFMASTAAHERLFGVAAWP